jgi:intein-encoded DNA endonuclease-like protein
MSEIFSIYTEAFKLAYAGCDYRTLRRLFPEYNSILIANAIYDARKLPELNYLIGAFIGDGCAFYHKKTRSYRIIFEVKDADFIESINDTVEKVLGKRYSIYRNSWNGYSVVIYSKELYQLLMQPLEKLEKIILQYPSSFLRGFFDAEGSVDINGRSIKMTNKNYERLLLVQKCLRLLGINSYIRKRTREDIYDLRICGYENMVKFREKCGSSIQRKMEKLSRIRKTRNWHRITNEIKSQMFLLRLQGKSIRQISKSLGISVGSVHKYLNGKQMNRMMVTRTVSLPLAVGGG